MSNDERPQILRINTLEDSVLELTVNVRNLVDALQVVGALSAAQQEQAVRQVEVEKHAKDADTLSRARYRRITMVQRLIVVVIVIVVPAASLLAYWTLTVQVNQKFTKEQNDLTTSCGLRNKANVEIPLQRERALAAAYKALNDPSMEKIHQNSVDQLSKAFVDCSIYKRK